MKRQSAGAGLPRQSLSGRRPVEKDFGNAAAVIVEHPFGQSLSELLGFIQFFYGSQHVPLLSESIAEQEKHESQQQQPKQGRGVEQFTCPQVTLYWLPSSRNIPERAMPSGKTTKTATREKTIAAIRAEYGLIKGKLNERERRRWAAERANRLGRGGQSLVAAGTGLTRPTIIKGSKELAAEAQAAQVGMLPEGLEPGRARRPGGGRRSIAAVIVPKLDALIEPLGRRAARTKSPLRWSCQSTEQLAEILSNVASRISERTVTTLLEHEGYTLSHNRGRKAMTREDRDHMCRAICEHVREFVNHRLPAMFVDLQRPRTASGGEGLDAGAREIEQRDEEGVEERVMRSHWSSVSIDRHTADFAGRGITTWWTEIGREQFRNARRMIVVAALSGNDRQPAKAWGAALQRVANETRLRILRRPLPPAIYRWQSLQSRIRYLANRATGSAIHQAVISCIGRSNREEALRVFFDSGDDRTAAKGRTARPTNQSSWSESAGDGVWNDEIAPE